MACEDKGLFDVANGIYAQYQEPPLRPSRVSIFCIVYNIRKEKK